MTPIEATFLWLAGKFGKDAIETGVKLGWDAARWQRAAKQYGDKIEQDYGRLPIFGKERYVPIDDIYTYVHVLAQEDAIFLFAEEKLAELYVRRDLRYDPDNRQDGWRMVADGDDLFILGDPGAGKTTFLKMAAIKAARGQLRRQEDVPSRIPIFIALGQHARSGRSLYESVKHELNVCGFPEADLIIDYLLRSGRALLLWDALDEVNTDQDQRANLVAEMHDFMRKYDGCQYVISCRIAAADSTFHERRLRYVQMAPFSDNQVKRYLGNWFGDNRELAARCFTELQDERNKGLRELASTPILLTLLAIAYEETLSFPTRRIDIYYQAIEALLRKWDATRGIHRGQEIYEGLELGYKWDLMTEISAEAFYNGEYLLTRQEWGERIREILEALPEISGGVDGGLVLDSLAERHGLFVRQTNHLYSLPQLSFQEYFTARDIKENIQHGSLKRLLDHMNEDRWREVFLLTASSLRRRDAAIFFALYIERLQKLAADTQLINQLLEWTNTKSNRAVAIQKNTYRLVAIRAWYFALPLDYIRGLVRSRTVGRDRAIAYTRPLILSQAIVRALDIDLARDRDFTFFCDRANVNALDQIKKLCLELGLDECCSKLNRLIVPNREASPEEWCRFKNELITIVEMYRNLSMIHFLVQPFDENDRRWFGSLNWSDDGMETCNDYLQGIFLLLDCLEVASITNRQQLEEQLLLLPA